MTGATDTSVPRWPATLWAELDERLGKRGLVSVAAHEKVAHAYDWWPLGIAWRRRGEMPFAPDAVVHATCEDEIAAVLEWANARSIPVTAWGLGSSVVGGPVPARGGLVLDTSRMNRIGALDEESMHVTVEPGVNGGALEAHLRARSLTLQHSPQSLHRSSVGGWLATRASGQFSSRYGNIEDLCAGFRAVLADGTRVAVGGSPRMAVGPDLRHLLIGSEGCLGIVTQATLRVFPLPQARRLETLAFPDVASGISAMRAIMLAGLRPFLLRFYDAAEAAHAMKSEPVSTPVMFLGTEGLEAVATAEIEAAVTLCRERGAEPLGPSGAEAWLERRYDFSTIERVLSQPSGVAETIEIANTWRGIGATYAALTTELAPLADEVLGHFSHAYTDGVSLYVILLGDAGNPQAAEARLRQIWDVSMRVALDTGAALSHHHGTGMARADFVREALGSAWPLYDRLKTALDANGILNPGKLGH
jgi:alkyldihydroxyacetonephosphate synthase